MAHGIVADREFIWEYKAKTAFRDILKITEPLQGDIADKTHFAAAASMNELSNNADALNRNYRALIDNFVHVNKEKKAVPAQQILEFSTAIKAELDLTRLEKMHNIKFSNFDEMRALSKLLSYVAYFLQSVDTIESLSGEMRVIALEEVLDTLCAATKLDGIFFKNFYIALNMKNSVYVKFFYYVIGVYIMQMFFVIEQFSFLAQHCLNNGSQAECSEYLRSAFLIFTQMKSQLVGKRNMISQLPFDLNEFPELITWQNILRDIEFPDISKPCYRFKANSHLCESLHIAALQGDIELMQAMLQNNASDLNTANIDGFTPLHCAAIADGSVVERLLAQQNIDVNVKSKAGLTALHIAVLINGIEVVKMLLDSPKIDVNQPSLDDWTPLHMAVALRRVEIVAELLKLDNVNINAKMFGEISALHIAARLNDANLIAMLLAQGAEVGLLTTEGLTAHQIAEKFGCLDALKMLQAAQTPQPLLQQNISDIPNRTTQTVAGDISLPDTQQSTELSCTETKSAAESYKAALLKQLDMEDGDNLTTQLFRAVVNGELDKVKSLVTKGVDMNVTHSSGKSVLDVSVLADNVNIFEYFLNKQHLVDDESKPDITKLLFDAVACGSLNIVKFLIEVKNLNPQLKNSEEETLLCTAITNRNFEVSNYLIEDQGVPLTSTPENCPLCSALEMNDIEVINYILEKDSTILDECDQRKAGIAAIQQSKSNSLKHVLELGSSVDVRNNAKRLFDYAAIVGNLDILKYLADKKNCELNTTIARSGLNTLFQVARVGTLRDIKYLVEEQKFSIFDKGPLNGTILHEAAFNRNLEVIKYFVEKHGFDMKARDAKSFIPLFYAAQDNNLAAVQYFVENRKLGVHLKDKHNRNLLHIGTINGSFDVVRYLVEELQVNLDVQDNDGCTSLLLCAKNGHIDLCKYFINRGSDLTMLNVEKRNILHLAAEFGNLELVEILVGEKGMDIDARDINGNPPRYYASSYEVDTYLMCETKGLY